MTDTASFSARVRVWLDAAGMPDRMGWRSGVRPNHRIPGRGKELFLGQLEFERQELVRPGECVDAVGRFIVSAADLPLFVAGFRWELCEGPQVVGHVELLERLDA